jgi:hypothetical protein
LTLSAGVLTATVSATAGDYTVEPADAVATTGGGDNGATFNILYGVLTVTVNQAGSYTVLPSNPVASTSSTGGGTLATFTMAWGILSVTMSVDGEDYTTATCTTSGGTPTVAATLTPVLASYNEVINTDGGQKNYLFNGTQWQSFS